MRHSRLRSAVAAIGVTVLFALSPTGADGRDYTLGSLRIERAYARPTPPGARTGSAWFTLRNTGEASDRLVGVASPVAAAVELHSMTMDGNVMRMRPVVGIDIPAGSKVALASRGYHVMLIELARPLVAGDEVALTLTFARAGSIDVVASVEAAGSAAPAKGAAHAH